MKVERSSSRKKWIIRAHRTCAWLLVIFSMWTIYTGYSAARSWTQDVDRMTNSHIRIECFFLLFFGLHVILTGVYFRANWNAILKGLRNNRGLRVNLLRLIQNVSAWLIILTAIMVIGSGLMNPDVASLQDSVLDPWEMHRFYDIFLSLMIVVHTSVGLRFYMMRKRMERAFADVLFFIICISSFGVIIYLG